MWPTMDGRALGGVSCSVQGGCLLPLVVVVVVAALVERRGRRRDTGSVVVDLCARLHGASAANFCLHAC